jgi:hypothetical protein
MQFEERYGWTAQIGSAPLREPEENRHPVLRLEKGGLWAEMHGEPGAFPLLRLTGCSELAPHKRLVTRFEGRALTLAALNAGADSKPAMVTIEELLHMMSPKSAIQSAEEICTGMTWIPPVREPGRCRSAPH